MTGYTPEYRWRPDALDPDLLHLTIDGQTAYTSIDLPDVRWVWGVCGEKALAEGSAAPGTARCPACHDWALGRPTTKSPRSAGPKPDGAGA